MGYAGANGMVFQHLARLLAPDHVLAEWVLPLRGRRLTDAPAGSIDQLCTEAAMATAGWPTPPVLIGYSFGGLLAYELACQLTRAGRPPRGLVICASNAPHCLPPSRNVHQMDLQGVRQHLIRMGGTPAALLGDDDMLAFLARPVQHDYRLLETYRWPGHPPLPCPIQVIAGDQDPFTDKAGLQAWQAMTEARFDLTWLPAGHFFLNTHEAETGAAIKQALSMVNDALTA
nr:alpha/beta fold hydrolase [Chitinivorax tropicus]